MLALTVRAGDYITIGDDVVIQMLKVGDVCRVAIDAPREVPIERGKASKTQTRRSVSNDCGRSTEKTIKKIHIDFTQATGACLKYI